MSDAVLYEIVGLNWRLPMHVRMFNEDIVQVELISGFHYLQKQREALFSLSKPFIVAKAMSLWRMNLADLPKIAEPSSCDDPEDVVIWAAPLELPKSEDFITAYSKWDKTMIENTATAKVVWDSLCRYMQHWMLVKEKPIDFGFAKLYALMARKTWDIAIYNKFRMKDGAPPVKYRGNQFITAIKENEDYLCKVMTSEDILAWDSKREICRWVLEVAPSKSFEAAMIAVEEMRRGSKTQQGYFNEIVELLKRQIPTTYELFRHFAKEASIQIPRFPASFTGRERVFKKAAGFKPKKSWHKIPLKPRKPRSVFGSHVCLGAAIEDGSALAMVSENASLSTLPDLQLRCQNVRDAGPGMDQSGGESGTGGVPVLHAAEGQDGGELLDLRPSGGNIGGGVEKGPE